MKRNGFQYVIRLQFLGFRYSGWQQQPHQKTIEQMIRKTLKYILPDEKFKVLGASRTDAKVSALDAAFELFLEHEIDDFKDFLAVFNRNLPPDIRAMSILEVDDNFNIIQNSKKKEYIYLFSYGAKNHPFSAPFIANVLNELNLEQMKEGAKLFEGKHDFSTYTARLQENTKTIRTISYCEIQENTILQANFFPEKSYALYVRGEGFMRYQIRMIMGALIHLGEGKLSLQDIKDSLHSENTIQLNYVAPASGLLLNTLKFQ